MEAAHVPRIAAQSAEYLRKQPDHYASGAVTSGDESFHKVIQIGKWRQVRTSRVFFFDSRFVP
jgi:hypothetical protein